MGRYLAVLKLERIVNQIPDRVRFVSQRLEMHGQLNQIQNLLGFDLLGIVDCIMDRVSFTAFENVPETDIDH